jgi:carbon storage regulator
MLVLTRKSGEGFWIGDDTEIVVMSCQRNSIRIGVRAPRDVVILRTELKLVAEQNQVALSVCSPDSIEGLAARLRSEE